METMGWTRTRDDAELVEWERSDGRATLRARRRPDDAWVVRLDRLAQAPEGSHYREDRPGSREAALALVEQWREAYDVEEA